MKYCPYCGEPLPAPNVKFCPECGERLGPRPTEEPRPSRGRGSLYELDVEDGPRPPSQQQPPQSTALEEAPALEREEPKPPAEPQGSTLTPEELWRRAVNEEPEEFPLNEAPEATEPLSYVEEPEAPAGSREARASEPEEPRPEPEAYEPEEAEPDTYGPEEALYVPGQRDDPEDLDEEDAQFFPELVHQEEPRGTKKQRVRKPPKPPKPKKRKGRGGRVLVVFLAVVLLLACGAGYLMLRMNQEKAPEEAAGQFTQAVFAGDVKTVLATLETAGSGLSSSEDVAAMCEAVSAVATQDQFQSHLLAMGDPMAAGYNSELSCFTLKQTHSSLFSQKFAVKVSPIQVLVKTSLKEMTLYSDDKKVTPEQAEDGFLLKLAPGSHTVHAVFDGYGVDYELGSAQVSALQSQEPQTITLQRNAGTLEIELAGTETNLQVLVNGSKTSLVSDGGFVVVDPAFAGMEVTIQCDQYTEKFPVEESGWQSASVAYISQLEGSGQASGPQGQTNRQLMNQVAPRFYAFYTSYLEAINKWDQSLIKNVSADYKDSLIDKMEKYNKDLLFEFYGMTFDRRSLERSEKSGELYVTFNIQTDYNYTYKEDSSKWYKGGNYQAVTMHYNTGAKAWEVMGTVIKDEIPMSADLLTIKP